MGTRPVGTRPRAATGVAVAAALVLAAGLLVVVARPGVPARGASHSFTGVVAPGVVAPGVAGADPGSHTDELAAPVTREATAALADPVAVGPAVDPSLSANRSEGGPGPALGGGPSVQAPPPPLPRPLSEPNRVAASGRAGPDAGSGAVWPGDFPDPFVLRVGATYHAFATQSGLTQVQTLTSSDLRTWQRGDDALPRLPSWAEFGYLWAPSVLPRTGGYVLYYATRVRATGRQCLSRAVSVLPQGPYLDTSNGPFICQLDRGGSIDPSPFVDADGTAWLTWKSEGTLDGEPTRLWSARLSADGLSLAGPDVELLHTEQPWEQPIIERPSLWRAPDGRYYLFYAGNRWQSSGYAVGWARCAGPAGPCTRGDTRPFLASHDAVAGPGSAQEFTDIAGVVHMAFCSWTAPDIGYPGGARRLHLATLSFSGGRPSLHS
ncbi:MAG: hypothetical protein NVS3B12_12050 [Acidimicrobiales bacterium]